MIGRRLLHFEILEKLGEGGMGVVYKACDTHLDRLVAIKVLPAEKVADAERRRRFVQEARAASALNHPHIITVHDITQAEGLDFIVMEHIDGRSLDALIPRAGMRLSEVLKIGVQIAQALAAAHSKGIVHRDLKPANVMVGSGGAAKVLDFGLAKLDEPAAGARESQLPTGEARTGAGVVLGTAAYMSPEQAEGKPVDARSDIFSFGAVLYEMATGRPAFTGDNWASTISAVLSREPEPLDRLPHDLEKLILRCLRKDPAKRFQHMDDVCVALEELKEESDAGRLGAAAPVPLQPRAGRRLLYAAAAFSVFAAAAGAAWRWAAGAAPPAVPMLDQLTTFPGREGQPAFSPDGKQVAFSWNGPNEDNFDIYVMLLGTALPVRLTTEPAPDAYPAWSPDGRQIAFQRLGKKVSVVLMSALGGSEREIGEVAPGSGGIDWSPDGKQVAFPAASEPGGVSRIVLLSPDTGERRVLTSPPMGTFGDGMPRISPDGRTLAFLRRRSDLYWDIGIVPLAAAGGEARFISPPATRMALMPVAWTRDSREIVFAASYQESEYRLWRLATAAGSAPAPVLGVGPNPGDVAVAPQGGFLAYRAALSDVNIWRFEVARGRGAVAPVTWIASTKADIAPEYSPDGRRIAFGSNRSGSYEIWTCGADGSNPVPLTHTGATETGSPRWSPDGEAVAFDSNLEGQPEIYTVSAGGGPPRRLTRHPGLDVVPTWSRDGRWIYFTSDRSGSRQLWKMPAAGGEPVQVTRQGGVNAFESADGATLYYAKDIDAPGIWKMRVAGGDEQPVLDVPAARQWGSVAYDDRGIYYIARDGDASPPRWAIFFYEFAAQQTGRVAALARPPGVARNLAVSPDRRWVLFSQLDASGADLMLLKNFR